jgi:hypothetical protein
MKSMAVRDKIFDLLMNDFLGFYLIVHTNDKPTVQILITTERRD